jgi:hypothetical protein
VVRTRTGAACPIDHNPNDRIPRTTRDRASARADRRGDRGRKKGDELDRAQRLLLTCRAAPRVRGLPMLSRLEGYGLLNAVRENCVPGAAPGRGGS